MHANAKTGSGGVGFLIKQSVLDEFGNDVLESFNLGTYYADMVDNNEDNTVFNNKESHMKFNVKAIPSDFMTGASVCQQLHATVLVIESNNRSQGELVQVYNSLCTIIVDEMRLKLPYKYINASSNNSNKKERVRKPWWNEELTNAWNEMRKYEKDWLACKVSTQKVRLKYTYRDKRNYFDRITQNPKRLYWFKIKSDLLREANHDQNKF